MAKAKFTGATLEGMAKVLEAFFKKSPAKTVKEVAEHVGKHGADDLVRNIAKAGDDDLAKALAKQLDDVAGKGTKATQDAVMKFGDDLESAARKAIDERAVLGSPPKGASSWTDHVLDMNGQKLIDDQADVIWHGHHVPFKNPRGAVIKQQTRDVQLLLAKEGIDPIYGREVLMVAENAGHTKTAQKEILDSLQQAHAKGGREAMLEALEKAKGRFVPPYPTLKPK